MHDGLGCDVRVEPITEIDRVDIIAVDKLG